MVLLSDVPTDIYAVHRSIHSQRMLVSSETLLYCRDVLADQAANENYEDTLRNALRTELNENRRIKKSFVHNHKVVESSRIYFVRADHLIRKVLF